LSWQKRSGNTASTTCFEAKRALDHFAAWIHSTPDLSSLHENGTAILAVAQHYRIATSLLDFTRSPRVAAFFGTDGAMRGDTGTIICLNHARFTESWSDINRRHTVENGFPLTELIEIDVRNLWRLQAQAGVFLRCHIDPAFLEMFSCFLHIHFPQQSDTALDSTESIYPSHKSHLEVLLDQYFLVQLLRRTQRSIERTVWCSPSPRSPWPAKCESILRTGKYLVVTNRGTQPPPSAA